MNYSEGIIKVTEMKFLLLWCCKITQVIHRHNVGRVFQECTKSVAKSMASFTESKRDRCVELACVCFSAALTLHCCYVMVSVGEVCTPQPATDNISPAINSSPNPPSRGLKSECLS